MHANVPIVSAADVDVLRVPPSADGCRPPFARLPEVVAGRGPEIDSLIELADSDRRVHVLAGPAGVGKTTVALAAARGLPDVMWAPARNTVSLVEGLAAAALKFGAGEAVVSRAREMCGGRLEPEEDAAGLDWEQDARRFAWAMLRLFAAPAPDGRRRVLVIDGADDPDLCAEVLEEAARLPSGAAFVVVTTRHEGAGGVRLGPISPEDSAALLLSRVPDLDDDRRDAAGSVAADLAGLLGGLPLALHVAGSQHGSTVVRHTLDEYASELREITGAAPPPGPVVRLAVRLALKAIGGEESAAAGDVLRLLAALAPSQPFPLDLLDAASGSAAGPALLRRAWRNLRGTGLLEFGVDDGAHVVTLHPLVAEAVLGEGGDGPDAATALDLATQALAGREGPSLTLWRLLVPHVDHVLAAERTEIGAVLHAAGRTVRHLLARGMYRAASAIAEAAVTRSSSLAPDDPDRLAARLDRGLAFQARGLYTDACRDIRHVAVRERRRRGAADRLTLERRLTAEHHLGAVLHDQGARGGLARSERILVAVLAFRSLLLGPDHPDALATRHRLALVVQAAGNARAAFGHLVEVLDAREQVLGLRHPDTLTTMHSKAYARQAMGGPDSLRVAGEEFAEVLRHRRRVLGDNHPNTLVTEHNLAWVEQAKGRYVAAETMFRSVLAVQLRRCGPDHPHTLATAANLAWDLLQRKQFDTARRLFKQVLRIRRNRLGPNHPDTQTTRGNIGWLTYEQGNLAEATHRFERLVDDRVDFLGAEHPRTLTTRHNLALSLRSQRRYEEALTQFEQVLAVQEQVLIADHESTLSTRYNLAVTLRLHPGNGNLSRSIDLLSEVLDKQLTVFSARHPTVVQTREELIAALRQRGTAADLDRASDERTPSRAAGALSRHRGDHEYDDDPGPATDEDPLLEAFLDPDIDAYVDDDIRDLTAR
ncbi:ATP-binding protein [Actinoplanes sp. LDG1-06]|uniref:ATP-binding protein n=1 Tax=Paractinoplanes ovalisporus TaxID=2810368 RepID=A0ABS2ASI7_9ACTN|nr:tetratricopeptide repeat protein [Actinoplanes ovalisporus]MBM2622844.1 ATP-binding protein [Actinoplanes ovalisporus]